jgi:hypothetical protein
VAAVYVVVLGDDQGRRVDRTRVGDLNTVAHWVIRSRAVWLGFQPEIRNMGNISQLYLCGA